MGSIEVDDLTKTYGAGRRAARALDGASFRYEGSGAIGYLGPNGAGKSTTLKLLVGLLAPTRGVARLNGVDVVESRKRALWDVGAVIETPEPYPTQTIREALEMVGRFRGLARTSLAEEIRRLSEELHLPDLERRNGSLSKGQGQRVVLAAALLGDPVVLLLDEPGSGLDPAERVVLRNLLVRLKRDHLILLSSHNMAEVSQVCDQLIFIDHGRIVLKDRVDAVAARVRSRQVDVEFAAPVGLDDFGELRASLRELVALSDRRFRLVFDGSPETRRTLLDGCTRIGAVVSFANTSALLEEAYLQLIAPDPAG
jgi:ABC-2 type transport system ATP-binding protein